MLLLSLYRNLPSKVDSGWILSASSGMGGKENSGMTR